MCSECKHHIQALVSKSCLNVNQFISSAPGVLIVGVLVNLGLPTSRDAQRAVANATKAAEAAAMRAARLAAAVGEPYQAPSGISPDLSDIVLVSA